MKRKWLTQALAYALLSLGCARSLVTTAGGGGTETVAFTIPLPAAMQTGGTLVYGDTTISIAPGASSVVIAVPKNDSASGLTWMSGGETVVLSGRLSAPQGAVPKILLFVHGAESPDDAADSLLRAHIMKEGIIVLPAPDSLLRLSDTAGMNGICISATARAEMVGAGFRNAALPLLDCNYLLLDSLGLCGGAAGVDYGSRHPVDTVLVNGNAFGAAGLAGLQQFFAAPPDSFAYFDWGRPPQGTYLTVVDPLDTTRAQAFVMETGTALIGNGFAPARRGAFLFWRGDAADMTSKGLQVFRSIVRWVVLRS
jgi:hypothetical protein